MHNTQWQQLLSAHADGTNQFFNNSDIRCAVSWFVEQFDKIYYYNTRLLEDAHCRSPLPSQAIPLCRVETISEEFHRDLWTYATAPSIHSRFDATVYRRCVYTHFVTSRARSLRWTRAFAVPCFSAALAIVCEIHNNNRSRFMSECEVRETGNVCLCFCWVSAIASAHKGEMHVARGAHRRIDGCCVSVCCMFDAYWLSAIVRPTNVIIIIVFITNAHSAIQVHIRAVLLFFVQLPTHARQACAH